MKKLLTLAATALVAATATIAPAEAETFTKTCRFERQNQRTMEMPCFITFQGKDIRVTWADGAIDVYTQFAVRNGVGAFRDGLNNTWYAKRFLHNGDDTALRFQHENADRDVYIF